MTPLVYAHRGASAAAPENTLEAFALARTLGADWVELDARLAADGGVVVRHDPLPPGDVPAGVPTLAAALDACRPLGVNVELKDLPGEPTWAPDEATAAAVARVVASRRDVEVVVSSFAVSALDRVRDVAPAVPLALLTLAGYDQLQAIALAAGRGHVALHPQDAGVTEAVVAAAHEAGLAVNVWTVDDPDRMRQLADWGVDGICTDDVALAVRVLRG